MHIQPTSDKYSCWLNCKNDFEFNSTWFTYDNLDGNCFLLDGCPEYENNPQFISGHKYCDYSISTTTASSTTASKFLKSIHAKIFKKYKLL